METAIINIITAWGPPGALALFMWVMLGRSEGREAKKDLRIQYLENQLTESYDERIASANQVSDGLHANSVALTALVTEIKDFKRHA